MTTSVEVALGYIAIVIGAFIIWAHDPKEDR